MRTLLLLGLLCLAPGCIVRGYHPHRPPPRPPSPRAMSYDEAVSMGFSECRSRGLRCELKEAHLTGRDVWKVKFHAFAPSARGHLHLEYQAYTRELLDVDEKLKGRERDRDDWDDDDDGRGHGRGRGKKKGHSKHDDDD